MNKMMLFVVVIGLISGLCFGAGNVSVNITNPKDESPVFQTSMVDGTSSATSGMKVYVLVWPLEADGPWWVQSTQTKSDGSWESNAYFGRVGSIDDGKTFKIIAIVTDQELKTGDKFTELPPHLAKSDEIGVKRR
jgi:hypothetical protein